ncbi:putative ribonuclease H-like domain-containing protein [Tanacetum coccineum]
MKMEHYLAHTDYPIWEVIQKGNGPVSVFTDTHGVIKVLPPKTAEEILARERERKIRTTLLMALPEDHLAKFHKMTDAKEMWEAIKSRFGLHKGYDRFHSLLSQLEIHGARVTTEDANQKFLRSLPSAWSQVSLIMRTKPGIDTLSFDDLYNNLRVFELDVNGSTASSSSTQNVAFVFENTSIFSFFANQSNDPQLDHEDLEQLDEFDLEEIDLKWQVAKISMRIKKSKGNQESRRRDAWNSRYKAKDNGTRHRKQEETKALVTLDGDGMDWTSHSEDEQDNYAFMAYSSSGSDTEVTSCSKECKESYAKIKKLYDEQREQLGDASIEIQAYTQALKKVEAQLVAHQQNQLWYEEKIRFMKIDLDDKTDVLTYHKKLLAEAEKEKEELKAKVEKWHNSSKSLNILLNSQMSARDKAGLGYGDQMNKGVLSYENEVFGSLFDSRSSDIEDSPVNDRYAEGMHAVPPPMTGIYIPSGPDKEIDDSQFTYGPKQSKPSESDARSSDFTSCESNSSEETHESMPETVVNEPTVVSQPKVWTDAPIIEDYESDSDDQHVSLPLKEQETPSFANTIKHVKTPRQTVKQQNTCSKSPKPDKKDCSGLMSKKLGLGYGFTTKACFVCGSLSHLIRDCDFHEKRMAKQVELNKQKGKGNVQRENKPVWNNVQKVNHKNQFIPTAVLTRTGKNPVNTARASDTNNVSTARHNFNSQAALTNAARKINTFKPIVNEVRPKTIFHKTHSPFRRTFNRTTASRTNFSNQKVNTAEVKSVSAVGGKWETAVKPLAGCNWRPKRHGWNKVSKYNGGSNTRNCDYPQGALKNKRIVDSGCSKHMTGNKAYLTEYQDYNGGPVVFEGSKGYITGKDTECPVLSPDFKLPDENQVLLRVPRQNNMYSFNLENIVPSGGLACLIAKATIDESNKWHRRLGHVNFKNLNKLVKETLLEVYLPRAFKMTTLVLLVRRESNTRPHVRLNQDIIKFCGSKGIKREYNNATTLQQNGVAERKNRTLIEAARTMLADSFLPNTFWAEAVSTACYVLNRVLVTKPHNKTPYELITRNSKMEAESAQDYFVLPIWSSYTSMVKSSEAKTKGEKSTKNTKLKTNEKSIDQEDQAFLDELERLKSQEKEANDAAKALRKKFAQNTEDLLLQAGAARASSTNIVNTASIPDSTASPSSGLSFTHLTNTDQDDSEIPDLEDSYDNPNNGIFTNASYDDEGAVADFTNLETVVNKISEALEDESWVDAMHEELLQFKIQKVWILVGCPEHRQEEGIDYDDVFAPMARIEAIRIFLAYASYMGFIVYQMDVKSAFLLGTIDEEIYVSQPLGFVDPKCPKKSGYRRGTIDKTLFIKKDKNDIILVQVYVDDIIFRFTKKSWCDEFEALMKSRFQMSSMGELTFFLGLQTASTPIETQKPLVKDVEATDVDVHLYRSMIGSLMYLTASRPDIMFAVPQRQTQTRHLVSFDLEAYSDSDYAGANLDRKSTTGGCQFLGRRLISWQCKKQTIMATFTTEAEYVAAGNCCGQNPVFHSKTKHIAIRHHFIRDAYEKKLIQVLKIHTDDNVADLLTKSFDVSSLYEVFCEQKDLDHGDVFHRVVWVLESL